MNTLDDMKKKATYLVATADSVGYEFTDIEISIISIVGRAESNKDISPCLEEMFYRLYPDMVKRVLAKR